MNGFTHRPGFESFLFFIYLLQPSRGISIKLSTRLSDANEMG